MNNEEIKAWMKTLVVGDSIVIGCNATLGYEEEGYVTAVHKNAVKVCLKMNPNSVSTFLFEKSGSRSVDVWRTEYIQPMTPEWRLKRRTKNMLNTLKKLDWIQLKDVITDDDIVGILSIVRKYYDFASDKLVVDQDENK